MHCELDTTCDTTFVMDSGSSLAPWTLTCHEHSLLDCWQVFDLGSDGRGAPRLVADLPNFQRAAAAAGNGRDVFSERTAADRKGAAVVHIAVIPPTQSHR